MTLFNSLKNKVYQFINKLQKYLKIDLFYLIKGDFWLIIGKGVNLTVTFLLALAWANWINKETYGIYQYIFSLVGIISIFSLPEIETAISQAVARKFEGSFIQGFKIKLKWGILGSLSALGIAGYYWLQGDKNLSLAFLIIALFLPLFNASMVYVGFLRGRKLFNVQVKYDSIIQTTAVAIMILVLFSIKEFLFDLPDYIILLLIIVAYFLSRTLLRFFFLIKTKVKFRPNLKEDPRTIPFGKHLSFYGLIDILSSNLDKILLFHYLGAVNLAIYSFATLIPEQIKHISINPTGIIALPKFSVRSRDEIRKTTLRKISYMTILVSILVSGYIIIAPFVYQIFFPKYLTSVPYSQLFVLSLIPMSTSIISVIFRAKMMIRQLYQIRIIVPLVRVGLLVLLVPLYGIWGAVFGILGTRIFTALLLFFLFKKI